jgi:sugar lactone lactonase YvrE
VLGATGVALSNDGTLFVAHNKANRIAAVPDANDRESPVGQGGTTVTSGGSLNGPLGMTLAPNGNILTANAGDGLVVETSGDKVYLVTDRKTRSACFTPE